MKIADYGKAITSYIESPTTAQKLQAKEKAQTLGRTLLAEGSEDIVEPSKSMQVDTTTKGLDLFTIDDFKNKAEIYVGAYHNRALPLADIKSALNKFTQKGIDDGTFTADDAIKIVQDLKFQFQDRAQKQRLRDVIIEGTGTVDREEFSEGTKTKLVEFVEKFKLENNRIPTQTEIVKGTGKAAKTVKSYLKEGVDYAKLLTKSESAKLGGRQPGLVKEVAKEAFDDLKKFTKNIKGISIQVTGNKSKSVGLRIGDQYKELMDAFLDGQKTKYFPANKEGINKLKDLITEISDSEMYAKNVIPFLTSKEKLAINRAKAAMYKKQDPYGIYRALREYKTKKFPGTMSKDIVIQHGQPKFTTQTLSRFGLIPTEINTAPVVERIEGLRNDLLTKLKQKLKSTKISIADKKNLIDEYNTQMKGLRSQLKGTEAQGLVNFELLDIDEKGNVKKIKDISFNPKKGLAYGNELGELDLSKITKEQADELIALGKKKIDLELLKKTPGVTTLDKIDRPEKALLSDKFKTAFTKGAKNVGKVIKPLGYAFGANAVKSAISKADDMGIELSLADKIMAFDSGDADIAINNYRRRNDPEFAAAERAKDLAQMTDDFEEVGKDTTFGKYNEQIKNIKLP